MKTKKIEVKELGYITYATVWEVLVFDKETGSYFSDSLHASKENAQKLIEEERETYKRAQSEKLTLRLNWNEAYIQKRELEF